MIGGLPSVLAGAVVRMNPHNRRVECIPNAVAAADSSAQGVFHRIDAFPICRACRCGFIRTRGICHDTTWQYKKTGAMIAPVFHVPGAVATLA